MNRDAVESILQTVRGLPPDERIALADEIDRLAWRDRVQVVLDGVTARRQALPDPLTDDEIDQIVDEVRTETPLYERYWIRRRQSAH